MRREGRVKFFDFDSSGWNIWFAEVCICVALWSVFYEIRDRLFAMGFLLTKEQFCATGFQAMIAPETLLRLGNAGWPFTIVTAPAPTDQAVIAAVAASASVGIKSIKNDRGKLVGIG
jgi:hypothetical protein